MSNRIIIVGGIAGGATAAARLRRLDEEAEIIIFERGEYISFANCGLPYYIGGVIEKREKLLLQTPESMKLRYNIDVRVLTDVIAIDTANKYVTIKDLKSGQIYNESYDKLILSPGAKPVVPPIPGVSNSKVFVLRDMKDSDKIKAFINDTAPKKVLVVGGGFIGIEMTENLHHAGLHVINIEMLNQVLTPIDYDMVGLLHKHIRSKGVDLRLGTALTGIEEDSQGKLICKLSDNLEETVDMVVLCIGVRADLDLAVNANLETNRGSIISNEYLLSSDSNTYAVGDAISIKHFVTKQIQPIALAGPANRQARIAANNIYRAKEIYRGAIGTFVCKVFDYTAGATGSNEKQLKQNGIAYDKVYLHPSTHASYYPDASLISMKLLFSPDNGKVLGAQAIGKNGVDKRIDVISTAISSHLTVFDLQNLELSYAPPYSSAKDPVNMAGYIAGNVINGNFKQVFLEDLRSLNPQKDFLVDVRTPKEYGRGTIEGAKNIPLDEIRERIKEFPNDKRIVILCQVGQRGYIASRILSQKGYNVCNLSGGWLTFENANY